MKKNRYFLFLLLIAFSILPLAANSESPAAGQTEPAGIIGPDGSIQQVDRSPTLDIRNRFNIPNPMRKEKPGDDTPSAGGETAGASLNNMPVIAAAQAFGGKNDERLNDVITLSDGGFLLVGSSDITYADQTPLTQTAWALRFSQRGEKLWEYKHLNKESLGEFYMAKENPDGTLMLHYMNSLFSLRTDSLVTLSAGGELLDESPMSSLVYKIFRADGGILVDTISGLTKYDDNLNVLYELEDEILQHMEFITEDGLLFYGCLLQEGRVGDALAFMLNENGELQWDLILKENARFIGCVRLSDGDYLCTGYMENDDAKESGIAARIGTDGTVRYLREYDRDGDFFFLSHAYELQEGALLIGGSIMEKQLYAIHIDEDGNEIERFSLDLGRRVELASPMLRVIPAGENLFVAGVMTCYRNLLVLEDNDVFVMPLVLPEGVE